LHKILKKIQQTAPSAQLWFCPTIYTDQFLDCPVQNSSYLIDLKRSAPSDTLLFWTGPRIVSASLNRTTLASFAAMFPGRCLLWDNLYANDYCPQRLFVGPFCGRSAWIQKHTRGLLLNPTGLIHTDRFLLSLLGNFLAKRPAAKGWRTARKIHCIPDEFLKVHQFFASPYQRHSPDEFAPERLKAYLEALEMLVFEWKAPLHREWFPFLQQLRLDCLRLQNQQTSNEWILNRYPSLIAQSLVAQ
jgi:hyaluronoglucosaminidase